MLNITALAGTGFLNGAMVKLTKASQPDINGTHVVVVSATKITCTFNLSGAAVGAWNVVVTNTDGRTDTLINGFTVRRVSSIATRLSASTITLGRRVTDTARVRPELCRWDGGLPGVNQLRLELGQVRHHKDPERRAGHLRRVHAGGRRFLPLPRCLQRRH